MGPGDDAQAMEPSPAWWQARAVAMAAATAGGRAALAHYRSAHLVAERKADDSPVSIADRAAEAAVQALVREAFPDDGWLGEETGTGGPARSGRRWIVDPIDGTRNFLRGIPLWSTLVACAEETPAGPRVIAAAAALPALGELYDAVRGGGARLDGRRLQVSACATLDQALFCYETPGWFARAGLTGAFTELCAATGLQRGGGDAFFHLLVAAGRAEVVVEPSLSIWDIAATSLIVEEAGGRWSTLDGRVDLHAGEAVLTNGALHEPVLALLARARPVR